MMRKLILLIAVILSNFCFLIAQTTNTPEVERREMEQRNQRKLAEEKQRADFQRLESLKNMANAKAIRRTVITPNQIDAPYRKANAEELKELLPVAEDLNKYAEFLRQPKTGLVKLVNGKGCIGEGNIVNATADCMKYSAPGGGASYSFSVNNYRIEGFADLTNVDSNFKCLGINVLGILTNIGNIPLENVNLQTSGLDFLISFKPETKEKKVAESRKLFANGVLKDSFTYKSEWEATENTTYVLRSIAYKMFINLDKRNDIIIAFRVVRKSEDGSMTILWKELAKKGAPNLK